MTERRVSVPVCYSLDRGNLGLYGEPTLSGVAVEYVSEAPGSPARHFPAYARIAWDQDALGYPVWASGPGATVEFPARVPAGLRAIQVAEVYSTTPTGTTATWRVVLGGTDYYWDGAAWSAATVDETHWCTAAELIANIGTIDIAAARIGLSFKASLRTTLADSTPKVHGIVLLASVRPVVTSVDTSRHDVPSEELRIALVEALKALTFTGSEEFTSDGEAALDYSDGMGDYHRDVQAIEAAYDVTDDPGMDAALTGAWDAGTKTYALDSAPTSGHVLHVDFEYVPMVSLGSDDDLFTDTVPAVLVMQPGRTGRRNTGGVSYHRSGSNVLACRLPEREDLQFEVRVVGEDDGTAEAVVLAIQEWMTTGRLGPSKGRIVTLPTAGEAVELHWLGKDTPAVRERFVQQVFRIGAFGVPVRLGAAVQAPAVTEVDTGTPEVPVAA